MESSKKWALSFVALGFICLIAFAILSSRPTYFSSKSPEVAVVEVFQGTVYVLRANPALKEKIQGRKWIRAAESLEVGPDADLSVEFPSNYRLKIDPQSVVSFDLSGETARLFIKSGEISIENYGREGSLMISRDGEEMNATDYGLALEKEKEKEKTQKSKAKAPDRAGVESRLNQKIIQEVLKNVRPQFYKCYSQLLQKTPGVGGQSSLAFNILATGKVSQPEVSSSTLSDPLFKKCLLSVIERVEFPSFSGASINTVFPIRFE